MKLSITEQLEQAYARATMKDTAKHLRTPQDWQRVRDIQSDSHQARQTEQDNFRQDYPARVADAREAILMERASRNYTHPAPSWAAGQDRFNKDQIERQAHLRVHNAHQQTMTKIDAQENREVKEVVQRRLPRPPKLSPEFQSSNPSYRQQIKRER